MTQRRAFRHRLFTVLAVLGASLAAGSSAARAQQCGPFTDVLLSDDFCPAILEMHYLGLTAGTSFNTFGPTLPVTRQVLAAILSRTNEAPAFSGGNRRAALNQFWTTQGTQFALTQGYGLTSLAGGGNNACSCDGADVWVPSTQTDTVYRVSARDGKVIQFGWTGMTDPISVLSAMGRIFVGTQSGEIYEIDPAIDPPGAATLLFDIGQAPDGLAFDGSRLWVANGGAPSQVTIGTPGSPSWSTSGIGGFVNLVGILYDGANIWVTDVGSASLHKLDATGAIDQTVSIGGPLFPIFDGVNIWVPRFTGFVTVVRAATGDVVTALSGNGLLSPYAAAFDGSRVLVTNSTHDRVSVWRAADLAPLGDFPIGGVSRVPCSDGIDFFVPLPSVSKLARF
jgi:DNA-binding beta-propeller fold protein YncE